MTEPNSSAGDGGPVVRARGALALAMVQWVVVTALILFSFVVEAVGHRATSWEIDGVTVVVYVAFRIARHRLERRASPAATSRR